MEPVPLGMAVLLVEASHQKPLSRLPGPTAHLCSGEGYLPEAYR
jgi:hypothetical protein